MRLDVIYRPQALTDLYAGEPGQSLIEYTLLLALIAIISIGSITIMGDQISVTISILASTLQSAL